MRKLKIISSVIVCVILAAILVVEVYAATYINFNIDGNVTYYSTEIGAKIWGATAVGTGDTVSDYSSAKPMTVTSGYVGQTETNAQTGNVYCLNGNEDSFSSIYGTIGDNTLGSNQFLYIYIFIKNDGDRVVIPNINMTMTGFTVTEESVFFDVSATENNDPYAIKNSATGMSYLATISSKMQSGITDGTVGSFTANSSLDYEDVYVKRYKVVPIAGQEGNQSIEIKMSFMADVNYNATNVLSVYQDIGGNSSAWEKYGYNATLDAEATKIEDNSLSSLANKLDTNTAVTSIVDDYYNTVVYQDIDLVNIDVQTGEPIIRLSEDPGNFEWFGGCAVVYDGMLASGRELISGEPYSFKVDVYTYYPGFYIRRWQVGNRQWISISDEEFAGSVYIPETYVATFESTIFEPWVDGDFDTGYGYVYQYYLYDDGFGGYLKSNDNFVTGTSDVIYMDDGYGGDDMYYIKDIAYQVASNDYGIIPRSFVYNESPITYGSANYQMTNYYYLDNTGSNSEAFDPNATPTQAKFLEWSSNLTKAWNDANMTSEPGYLPNARISQGQNYTAYVYNWLYLIKYASNDSQAMVGYGNTDSYQLYNSATTISTPNGSVAIGGSANGATNRYESQIGSGTIGVYDSTKTINSSYAKGNTGIAYGYEYTDKSVYTGVEGYGVRKGIYAHQFLTKSVNGKTVLLDGYVGSDKYTSVFCLGQCNVWGNTWKWVFGNVIAGESTNDGVNACLYTSFENYDYNTKNWYTSRTYANEQTLSTAPYNYSKMTYNLPMSNTRYSYLGLSEPTGNTYSTLVGLPIADNNTYSLLSDYFNLGKDEEPYRKLLESSFGVYKGGHTNNSHGAGIFMFEGTYRPDESGLFLTFRNMLVV